MHEFINGEFGMGILYFFTCGLFLVGLICDIVKDVRGDNFSSAPTNISNNDSINKYAIICPKCKSNNITFQMVQSKKTWNICFYCVDCLMYLYIIFLLY